MKYKGYDICLSKGGGKAGKGFNKTGTVQVHEPFNSESYLLKKQIRYSVGDPTSLDKAMQKARAFVDDLVVKASESKSAS
jgi:hypothetical protein